MCLAGAIVERLQYLKETDTRGLSPIHSPFNLGMPLSVTREN